MGKAQVEIMQRTQTYAGGTKLGKFGTIIIYLGDDEREIVSKLKDRFEVRSQAAVFRQLANAVRDKMKNDPAGGSRPFRKMLLSYAEQARDSNPFANGRSTSVQLGEQTFDFLSQTAESLGIDRTQLVRAIVRAGGSGEI